MLEASLSNCLRSLNVGAIRFAWRTKIVHPAVVNAF